MFHGGQQPQGGKQKRRGMEKEPRRRDAKDVSQSRGEERKGKHTVLAITAYMWTMAF